jgi:hypothetical protein
MNNTTPPAFTITIAPSIDPAGIFRGYHAKLESFSVVDGEPHKASVMVGVPGRLPGETVRGLMERMAKTVTVFTSFVCEEDKETPPEPEKPVVWN